jgi:hypothetical protein
MAIRTKGDGDVPIPTFPGGVETIPEVALRGRTDADGCPCVHQGVEFIGGEVVPMDEGGRFSWNFHFLEESTRAHAVFVPTFFDLPWLFRHMHVEGNFFFLCEVAYVPRLFPVYGTEAMNAASPME